MLIDRSAVKCYILIALAAAILSILLF